MLTPNDARRAAELLMNHWDAGTVIERLPEALRPATRRDGYAVQQWMETLSGRPLFGWKVAATSEAGQRHINVDGPLAGRILGGRTLDNGAAVPIASSRMRVAELEFAFRMGADIAPRAEPYGVEEVLDAVASLHPALEFPDSRYVDFCSVGAAELIADNSCAHLFLAGDAVPGDWRAIDLVSQAVVATVPGKGEFHGSGSNVLGDPRIALCWLVNELSALGVTLRAGETVTTGTSLTPVQVGPGDRMLADFGMGEPLRVSFV